MSERATTTAAAAATVNPAVEAADQAHVPSSARRRRSDAAAAVLGPIRGSGDEWFYGGVGVAAALHVAILFIAIVTGLLRDLRALMRESRASLETYWSATYDVDLAPKKAPEPVKPIEAPEEPKPEVKLPQPKAPKIEDPYDQPPPPPSPAQAAKVLVKEPDPNERLDFTGNTIVNGDGNATYGQQSALGKGDKPTMSPNARLDGVPGGTGTGAPPPPPAPTVSRARAVGLAGSSDWKCPFPPEADADQVDSAVVVLTVTVKPDGTPLSATVIIDPGHGFGRAARMFALTQRFTPALDAAGNPITSTSAPITVRFNR